MMPTSKSKNKVIGITIGDPAGIGPEVVAKALGQIGHSSQYDFLIIGDDFVYKYYTKNHNITHPIFNTQSFSESDWTIGQESKLSGQAALHYLKVSTQLIDNDSIQALVTAPVSKNAIIQSDTEFTGHTEYLAKHSGANVGMMFVCNKMRTIIVTRHIPLKNVPQSINQSNILSTIKLAYKSLQEQFNIKQPKIAVCGLNPHAGESSTMGTEERDIITPAIEQAKYLNMNIIGPLAADTLFAPHSSKQFDCIVAMYHDQGLIPVKTLYFDKIVNLTIGLPYVRTSPAHGTAFDIAGQNVANPSSMIEAIQLAITLTQ